MTDDLGEGRVATAASVTGGPGATGDGSASMRLDHATLRTADLPGLRRFFEEVFGLRDGFRPTFGFPGHWLYEGDEPIVHLIPTRAGGTPPATGGERIDHIAFLRDDYDAFRERLDDRAIAYGRMELPEIGERRLFLHAPGGALIEVAFRDRRPRPTATVLD